MPERIKVDYKVYSTTVSALEALKELPYTIALDFEVQSLYSNSDRIEAKELLKQELDRPTERFCKLVAESNGLSYPSITKITHMIIGIDESTSIVIVISNSQMEKVLLNWIVSVKHHFLLHNASFDLKQVYVKTGKFPEHYDDTQLLAKIFINHADTWKANTQLKVLMGQYYTPKWTNIEGYDNEDLKDEAFLRYSAIDGAATMLLWKQLQEEVEIKKGD